MPFNSLFANAAFVDIFGDDVVLMTTFDNRETGKYGESMSCPGVPEMSMTITFPFVYNPSSGMTHFMN